MKKKRDSRTFFSAIDKKGKDNFPFSRFGAIQLKYVLSLMFLFFGTGFIALATYILQHRTSLMAKNIFLIDAIAFSLVCLVSFLLFKMARKQKDLLKQESRQYQKLFEENPTPMWVFDKETFAFLAVNKAAIVQYGYSQEEFYKMTILDIRPPEDIRKVRDNVAGAPEDYYSTGIWRHFRKDGSLIYVKIASHSITFRQRPAEIILAVDQTRQVLYEEERTKLIRNLLQQNNQLEEFAYVVSHQLRAPIANLLGLSSLISEAEASPHNLEVIRRIRESTQRLDCTLQDVARLVNVQHEPLKEFQEVEFEEILKEVKEKLEQPIAEVDARIESDFSALPALKTIRSYLRDILYRLLSNSLKFRHPDHSLHIRLHSYSKGPSACFRIQDNGIGLDIEKHGEKIGRPFTRFHFHVPGQGIGLSLVKSQLQILQGEIHFQSTPWQGMEVEVCLPQRDEQS